MITNTKTGFTLIELLVTIAVVVIVVAIGFPGFQNTMRNARMTAAVNDLITAFQLTRSEAVKRRVPAVLCVGEADGTPNSGCKTSKTWADGWIAFADNDNNGALTNGDEVVLRHGPVTDTGSIETRLAMTDQLADSIIYDASGFPRAYPDGTTGGFILFCDDRHRDDLARVIGVSQTGRPAAGGIDRLPTGMALSCES